MAVAGKPWITVAIGEVNAGWLVCDVRPERPSHHWRLIPYKRNREGSNNVQIKYKQEYRSIYEQVK